VTTDELLLNVSAVG